MNDKGKKCRMDIGVIPNNMDKYMAFTLGKSFKFIDSFQFLDKPVGNLPNDAFKYTKEVCEGERLRLMKRKGVYPYDYMDSFDRFGKTKLPKQEDFYSILNDEDVTEDDYRHAQEVWSAFSLRTMGEYHDLYLKSDVLLLADVFENFRRTCLLYYGLDPCHYFSSPGLSWDTMLKMTDVRLKLMTDVDMFQFIKKG